MPTGNPAQNSIWRPDKPLSANSVKIGGVPAFAGAFAYPIKQDKTFFAQ